MHWYIAAIVIAVPAAVVYEVFRRGIIHRAPSPDDIMRKSLGDAEDAHPSSHYGGQRSHKD